MMIGQCFLNVSNNLRAILLTDPVSPFLGPLLVILVLQSMRRCKQKASAPNAPRLVFTFIFSRHSLLINRYFQEYFCMAFQIYGA